MCIQFEENGTPAIVTVVVMENREENSSNAAVAVVVIAMAVAVESLRRKGTDRLISLLVYQAVHLISLFGF